MSHTIFLCRRSCRRHLRSVEPRAARCQLPDETSSPSIQTFAMGQKYFQDDLQNLNGSKILSSLFAKTIAKKENKHFRLNVTPNFKIHSAKNFKQAIKIIHPPANNFKLIGNILHVEVNFTYETERIHSF